IGDQTMLYDVQALEAASAARGCIVIVNNGGAAIFDISVPPQVDARSYLRAPNRTDFSGIAKAFAIPFERVEDAASLRAALARDNETLTIIEAVVPPESLA